MQSMCDLWRRECHWGKFSCCYYSTNAPDSHLLSGVVTIGPFSASRESETLHPNNKRRNMGLISFRCRTSQELVAFRKRNAQFCAEHSMSFLLIWVNRSVRALFDAGFVSHHKTRRLVVRYQTRDFTSKIGHRYSRRLQLYHQNVISLTPTFWPGFNDQSRNDIGRNPRLCQSRCKFLVLFISTAH
jgi:hypothetical protein